MPRAARSCAIPAMNGCAMPAPAPCASSRQARAPRGRCINPETRMVSLTAMLTGSGVVLLFSPAFMRPVFDRLDRLLTDQFTLSTGDHKDTGGADRQAP